MPARLSFRLSRRDMAVAGLAVAGTISAVSGYGALSAHEAREPRVSVLGAGSRLAILVTDGPARLLIVAGDNTTAFGNAWAASLPPLLRRVDVMYCSPLAADAPVVAQATRNLSYQQRRVLGPADLAGSTVPEAPGEMWTEYVRLSHHMTVTVSAAVLTPLNGATARHVWAAEIGHAATRVVTLSEPGAATLLADPTASALILQDGDPREALTLVETAALVTATASRTLRPRIAPYLQRSIWHIRVFAGDVIRLTFVPGGLRLPPSAITIRLSEPVEDASLPPRPLAIAEWPGTP